MIVKPVSSKSVPTTTVEMNIERRCARPFKSLASDWISPSGQGFQLLSVIVLSFPTWEGELLLSRRSCWEGSLDQFILPTSKLSAFAPPITVVWLTLQDLVGCLQVAAGASAPLTPPILLHHK